MLQLILLLFGILSTAHCVYRIPEHDPCVLRVLLCDDFIKPLTPIDNSTLEMFKTIGELNAVCDELSKFRICLKAAEIFCKENSQLETGFLLLKNRQLAFDLCDRGSSHQHVYMMVEECVNKYSHSTIQFCTDKAVEVVGLSFALTDIDSECRFLLIMHHCHVAVITDICGSIAGNMLEKLVVFRGERDFLCIDYEKERQINFEANQATLDSYVEQYRNKLRLLETEEETKKIDTSEKDLKSEQEDLGHDRFTREFQSRISPLSDQDYDFQSIHNRPFSSRPPHRIEKIPAYALSDQKTSSTTVPPETGNCFKHFCEKPVTKYLRAENYPCKTRAVFLLLGNHRKGQPYYIGCGEADVLWETTSPLIDISCAWMMKPIEKAPLSKCSVLINPYILAEEFCGKADYDIPYNATLAVYEPINGREVKRVVKLRVRSFVSHSSTFERSLELFEDFHDIRYWCSVHHRDYLYKFGSVGSTNRIGFIPSDVNKNMLNWDSKPSEGRYNFYEPENAQYPIDTEIHLISSGEDSLENRYESEDTYMSQDYNQNFHASLGEETANENSLEEPIKLQPFRPPISSHHSYRPYELYRPRAGEMLEIDQDVSSEDQEIKDCPIPKIFSIKGRSTVQLSAEEMCPALQENISERANKFVAYSKKNVDMTDPLDLLESENNKKLIYKKENDLLCGKRMLKIEEPKNVNTDDEQNQQEKIYVVTESVEIVMPDPPTIYKYEARKPLFLREEQSLDKDSQIFNIEDEDDNEDLGECDAKDLIPETDVTTKSENTVNSKAEYLQFISNQNNDPFSYMYIDASSNSDLQYEDEFSTEMFDERSDEKYPTEIDEMLYETRKVLSEVLLNIKRMRMKFHKMQHEEKSKTESPKRNRYTSIGNPRLP